MNSIKTFQDLFKRYRRPGDMVFALCFFVVSVVLLINLPLQTTWTNRTKLYAQPAFWPAVSLGIMGACSLLHLIGATVSERIPGRLAEVKYWIKSLEYIAWFMIYVSAVPIIGYLPATILFCTVLSWRLGYRSPRWMIISAIFAISVTLVFKGFLQVKIPAGAVYDLIPAGPIRTFFMTYL